MSTFKLIIYIAITTLLACCTSIKQPKGSTIDFKTRISSSGLKHFQLQLRLAKDTPHQPLRRNKEKPQGRSAYKQQQKLLYVLATREIEKNHFCRTGFWEIENAADARYPYIRGECNELATQQDKLNFAGGDLVW